MKSPLPIVDGISPSCRWLPPGPWKTILAYLNEAYPGVPETTWIARMERGLVLDGNGQRFHPESPYEAGVHLFYYREVASEPGIPFRESILHEDAHLLVVDKPPFLPVIPAGRFLRESLLVRLRSDGSRPDVAPLHRLDRETAGLVLFSVNPETRGDYASLFQQRKIEKVYEALALTKSGLQFPLTRRSLIVRGEPFFRMKEIAGTPNSETKLELVRETDAGGFYRIRPVTGRKHQIRVHLAALDIPILNDRLYPHLSLSEDDDFEKPLRLIARSFAFADPLTGQERNFESEYPSLETV